MLRTLHRPLPSPLDSGGGGKHGIKGRGKHWLAWWKAGKKSYLRDIAQGQERSGFACYTGHKIGSSSYLTKKQCLAFITPWWFFVCTNLQGICWPYAWKENTRTLLSPLSNNLGSQDMKSKRSSSRNRSLHQKSFLANTKVAFTLDFKLLPLAPVLTGQIES